jgi:ABC-2 type transport system ATP-binding protein
MLKLNDVSVTIQAKTILSQINFEVLEGEIFGLLGPNGSGKSTTLAVICGLMMPTKGAVQWADVKAVQGVSVVFQTPSLDKRLTVLQNLELTCRLFGLSKTEAVALIQSQIEKSGLSEHANKKVMELSGGLKRRVDLVRALLSSPRLLLLDEPTSGLDEASFRKFWEYLLEIKSENNLTIVMATHNPREAESCHRVALFSKAKIVEIAAPEALKKRLSTDVVQLAFVEAVEAQKAQSVFARNLQVTAEINGTKLEINTENGAAIIPSLVDALDRKVLKEVSLKNASMADVFYKITGEELGH